MYVEDRIASLCDRLLASTDPDEARAVARELQDAIHDHVEDLRIRAHTLPLTSLDLPTQHRII
jgi:phosphoribosylformylglycinamidine (FGAM) synthase PurS component